jgi:ubiquitin carboxyl-terminal hydrolase 7
MAYPTFYSVLIIF